MQTCAELAVRYRTYVLVRCSEEFTQYMSVSSAQQLDNIDALDGFRDRQQRTLQRNLSSGACSAAASSSRILPLTIVVAEYATCAVRHKGFLLRHVQGKTSSGHT